MVSPEPSHDRATRPAAIPPLEFGNRAFYGRNTATGNVVVIDLPSLIGESLVPIDAPKDVLVHAAYAAAPPSIGLLNRGFAGSSRWTPGSAVTRLGSAGCRWRTSTMCRRRPSAFIAATCAPAARFGRTG